MKRRTVGILAPWMDGEFLGNILLAVAKEAQRHEMQVMMTCTIVQTSTQRLDRDLIPYPLGADEVDAWILVGDALAVPAVQRLELTGAPIVTISTTALAGLYPLVVGDNFGGMAAAAQHLIDHGHTRIAFIGSMYMSDMKERYAGYVASMQANGLEVDPTLVIDVPGPWTNYGEQAADQLIERGMPCSAILCGNDDLALGLLERLRQTGYRMPEDVAVIGYDDREEAQYQDPPLSTVSQKSYALGIKAMELVVRLLGGETVDKGPYRVPTALVRRQSCGCGMEDLSSVVATTPLVQSSRPWQELVSEQLLTLAIYPLKPDKGLSVSQQWPAIHYLVQAIEAACDLAPEPDDQQIHQAWTQALELTANLKVLHGIISVLERTGQELIAQLDQAALGRKRLGAIVERLRYNLSQTLLAEESKKALIYNNERRKNASLTEALLHSNWFQTNDLSWLRHTSNQTGYLGLWEGRSAQDAPAMAVKGAYSMNGAPLLSIGETIPWTRFLPTALARGDMAVRDDEITLMVPFETALGVGGVACVVERTNAEFNQHYEEIYHWVYTMTIAIEREVMLSHLTRQQEALTRQNEELRQARSESEVARQATEEANALLSAKNEELERARSEADGARQAAEEANTFKSTFIANMSHELRTPLNTIINFTDFMGDEAISGVLNEQQQRLQERVIGSAEHLLGLINDILDMAKIESGKMELFRETMSLAPLLESVMASAIGLTKDKAITLALELPEDGRLMAHVDKTRIRQVLLNLLSNAAKFTEQGSITIRAVERGDGMLQISVQDTGIGIAEEKQHLVFEEFRQIDADSNRKHGGTGLGMPISKRFVEMHGGTMWLESRPGVGSTFFFTLPLAPELRPVGSAREDGPAQVTLPRILIVDDDVSMHEIIRAHLQGLPYLVEACHDSRQALSLIRENPPGLIILDIMMPHVGGWDLLMALRDDPRCCTIPVIMCSILDQQHLGITLGAQAYLAKPTRAEELLPIVRRWLAPAETVLVVDDDKQARQIVHTLLEQQGYHVVEAVDGRDGLIKLEATHPQAIILDLMMPELDGFAMLQQLRQLPDYATLPVVVITAKELDAHERDLLQQQAEACIQKHSLDPDAFVVRVQDLLGARG